MMNITNTSTIFSTHWDPNLDIVCVISFGSYSQLYTPVYAKPFKKTYTL